MNKEIMEMARASGLSVGIQAGVVSAFMRQLANFAAAVQAPLLARIAALEGSLRTSIDECEKLKSQVIRLKSPSPKTGYGDYLEYVYSAGCSSAHAQSTAITCHLQYVDGCPADEVNPAESARMDLCHAYIGGVDILNTLLDEAKIKIIEQEALEDHQRGEL